MVTCDICCTCLMPSLMACGTRWNIKSNENFSKSLLVFIDTLSGRTQDNAIRPSSFFTLFSVVRPTQIFGVFKKKSNDLVKPFFSGSNSFNLINEHSTSIGKNRNKNWNIEFNPTDRPTQYQETHSTLKEKKGGEWPYKNFRLNVHLL